MMPTDPSVIGFSNRWYPEGFANTVSFILDKQTTIRIFSLPCFFAAKWEAFKSRGNNNYRTSKDFEDLVYILENSVDFEEQMQNSPEHLLAYLKSEFESIIFRDDFEEGLYAHLTGGYGGVDANHIRIRLQTAFRCGE
jgi:predicted nucleotidyltransferase